MPSAPKYSLDFPNPSVPTILTLMVAERPSAKGTAASRHAAEKFGTFDAAPAEAYQPAKSAEVRFHLLLLIAALALGGLLQSYGPASLRTLFERVRLDSPSGLLALSLALLASVLAHELGHLLAAIALNYEILGAAVGPLQLDCWNRKYFFQWRGRQWSRCCVSAVPRTMDGDWRRRMMIVVAAGPFASLLFLWASSQIAASAPTPFWNACAEVNLFLVILGLVPNSRSAAIRNDAALFLALWRNAADAQDIFRCHQAIELSLRRRRPEDFPQPLLQELANFSEGRPYTHLIVARRMIEWAVDCGHFQLARDWDQAALAASACCGSHLANQALAESACLDVLLREDVRAASRKFAKVQFAELFPPSLAERARAAYFVATHQHQRAHTHILRAQYQLPLGDPYYNFERMLLDQLHHQALAQTK